jgi:hypothetical protein
LQIAYVDRPPERREIRALRSATTARFRRSFRLGAQRHCLVGVESGVDAELPVDGRAFLYMPLMHAEDRELQALSVATPIHFCRRRTAFEVGDHCRAGLDEPEDDGKILTVTLERQHDPLPGFDRTYGRCGLDDDRAPCW